jgi:hypothetical protein
MLASVFKSSWCLRIPGKVRDAMITLLGMMERGELVHVPVGQINFWGRQCAPELGLFSMHSWSSQQPCGTVIRQDVLILAGAEDHFVALQQTAEFEKALVNARSVTTRIFDRLSGGAGHCQPGALTLYHAAVFDWLLERFPAIAKRAC